MILSKDRWLPTASEQFTHEMSSDSRVESVHPDVYLCVPPAKKVRIPRRTCKYEQSKD
jgi:hypothetical protein